MSYVKYEQSGFVGIVTLDREKALNALNEAVLTDLERAISAIDPDTTRCVIITGAGDRAFAAGADIGAMQSMTPDEGRAFSAGGNAVYRKIEHLPMPVLAAVNGYALGGGCELALACDIRLAAENAVFGQPETGLGITPGFGGTQRLARTVGVGKAKEMIFSCRNVKAEEALRIGLVNAVYPSGQLMDAAKKLAGRIAGNAPIAVRQCKKAINTGLQMDLDSATSLEPEFFAACCGTEDQRSAMAAFCEKRRHGPFVNK